MDKFPPEVVTEILNRLPLRSLVKCQCVCKEWRSLISHHSLRRTPTLLLCSYPAGTRDYHPGPFSLHFSSYDTKGNLLKDLEFDKEFQTFMFMVPTCLDFVCFNDGFSSTSSLFLCNPTTQELITLPKIKRGEWFDTPPLRLGYLSSTNEFKALCFDSQMSCKVFTLGKDHYWREAPKSPFTFNSRNQLAYANGAIYVLPLKETFINSKSNDISIGVFYLNLEEWGLLPPLKINFERACYHQMMLSEFMGYLCLSVVFHDNNRGKLIMEIWLFKAMTWVQEYDMFLPQLAIDDEKDSATRDKINVYVHPWTLDKDGNLLLLVTREMQTFIVNCSSGKVTAFGDEDRPSLLPTFYLESFFSLSGSGESRNSEICEPSKMASSE